MQMLILFWNLFDFLLLVDLFDLSLIDPTAIFQYLGEIVGWKVKLIDFHLVK